ncbi:MAG TPA: hypothetical protein VL225_07875 [Vicinamibacterales bacterium]|jgi:hypothetical protein|nr:hypothetical protein [Vicinamibacterales bacterium]
MSMVLTTVDSTGIDRLQQRGVVAAVAGLVIGGIGVFLQPSQLMPSWLIGFTFCTGLSLGSLSLLMTQHMSGGQWGLVARRVFEAASRLLPYCALLFVPIALTLPTLYVWARPDAVRADEILLKKALYLNRPFFLARTAIYFTVWIGCSLLLNGWSAAQDRGEVAVTEADTRRFRVVSGPGLVAYVILMSLAAIDWLMSLDAHWYSTIFGFIMVAGQALCALSFAVAILAIVVEREPMNGVLRAGHFHDLGKLMLAFVMLWAYFSFSQFLIIWAGNLPEEITFYLSRLQHGWQAVSLLIVVGHFVLPFCLLLSADLKRRPRLLARVAWFIVAIRLVDIIWLVAPNFNQGGMPITLANIGIPVGLAGIWLFLFAGQLRKRALVPFNDPYFKEMLARGNHGGH